MIASVLTQDQMLGSVDDITIGLVGFVFLVGGLLIGVAFLRAGVFHSAGGSRDD